MKRFQYEAASMHIDVGNAQVVRFQDEIIIKDDIQI